MFNYLSGLTGNNCTLLNFISKGKITIFPSQRCGKAEEGRLTHVSGYGGFSNVSSVHFSLGKHLSYERELLYLIGIGFSHSKLLQFSAIDLPTVF